MKRYKLLLLFVIILTKSSVNGQHALFLAEGQIEFERKVNLHSQIENDNAWSDLEKKTIPKFKVSYFNLFFDKDKTLYQPGRENPDNNKIWQQPAEENVVYSDLANSKAVSQKKIFEQLFLVEDSVRNIQWKITDETRAIAGFQCRRANALIMDSIYVVAFYTDEIITNGGPESFSGLPGMILGVAIPHEHITWFATKVSVKPYPEQNLPIPKRGKKVNNAGLKETVQSSLKDWGKWGVRYVKAAML